MIFCHIEIITETDHKHRIRKYLQYHTCTSPHYVDSDLLIDFVHSIQIEVEEYTTFASVDPCFTDPCSNNENIHFTHAYITVENCT